MSAGEAVEVVAVVSSKSRKSRFGPPFAVVAVARILLLPMATGAVTVFVAQVSQLAVAGNDTAVATVLPLIAMSIGRSTVVPLAYRNERVALPAADALTVNSTEPPVTLV